MLLWHIIKIFSIWWIRGGLIGYTKTNRKIFMMFSMNRLIYFWPEKLCLLQSLSPSVYSLPVCTCIVSALFSLRNANFRLPFIQNNCLLRHVTCCNSSGKTTHLREQFKTLPLHGIYVFPVNNFSAQASDQKLYSKLKTQWTRKTKGTVSAKNNQHVQQFHAVFNIRAKLLLVKAWTQNRTSGNKMCQNKTNQINRIKK